MEPEPAPTVSIKGNQILKRMPAEDRAFLSAHLEHAPFANGDFIARAGEPIEHLCFLEQGIAGVVDALEGDRRYAVGLVGAEGFVGWPILLGNDRWPSDVVMRAEDGDAWRISASALLSAAEARPAIRSVLLRFVSAFMIQMNRTVVSSLAHPIERRMARWILMYHDRVQGDEICMTHEEFRLMLGVRRSSVTDALHRLEEQKAIRATRGLVLVRNRDALIHLAGDTYGYAEREYARIMLRPEKIERKDQAFTH